MKKQTIRAALLVAALASGLAAYAQPTLFITDGVNTDGPITGTNGIVSYSNPNFGGNWSISIANGESKPVVGSATSPDMDLLILATSTGPGNPLTIIFSDNGFGPALGSFATELSAHMATGAGSVSVNSYYDAANTLLALTSPLTASGNIPLSSSPVSVLTQGGSIAAPAFSLTEVVTLSAGASASYSVDATLQALSVECAGGAGQVGIPYSSAVVPNGGVGPFTFALISGSLPPGLTLDTTTGAITGTPTQAGTSHYVVQVTDAYGQTADNSVSNCGIIITGCTGSICGSVVKDSNCDGKLSGESGIAGVTVTLKTASGTVVATTTTDTNGDYCFYGLNQGTYIVVVTPPASCHETKGCVISTWTDCHNRKCWTDWDNCVHWKNSDGTHCWLDNFSLCHWQDNCGNGRWQCLDWTQRNDQCATETCKDSNGCNDQRQVCLQTCQNAVLEPFGYATCTQFNYCQPNQTKNCFWNSNNWNYCYWNHYQLNGCSW